MAFNGPELSLAPRLVQEGQGVRGGEMCPSVTFYSNLNTAHNLERFLVTCALFSGEANGKCDVIQLLKFILTPGAFPTIVSTEY